MNYLFLSAVALSGLLTGCGNPLEKTWKTGCDGGQMTSLILDGKTATLVDEVYLEPECTTLSTVTTQPGSYVDTKSKKEGVLDSLVITLGETLEVAFHTPEEVKNVNLQLESNVARLIRDQENRARNRDSGATESSSAKAQAVRSEAKLKQSQEMAPFEVAKPKTLTRFQIESAGIHPRFPLAKEISGSYTLDNEILQLRLNDGPNGYQIFKQVEKK